MQDLYSAGGRDRVSGVTQQQMAIYEPGSFDLQVKLSKHAANIGCMSQRNSIVNACTYVCMWCAMHNGIQPSPCDVGSVL